MEFGFLGFNFHTVIMFRTIYMTTSDYFQVFDVLRSRSIVAQSNIARMPSFGEEYPSMAKN